MEVSRRRAALLAALCICAAACLPPPARAAAATTTSNTTTSAANATAPSRLINSTQCRWNAQLFTCELSPGFLVATFANSDAPLNAYAQGLVRAAAVELTCNQLANVSTCEADARCTYDSTVIPRCRANARFSGLALNRTWLCPGSLAAAYLPCAWASGLDECAAAGPNCTWSSVASTCTHRDVKAMSAAELEELQVELAAYQTLVYDDCPSFQAYSSYATACADGNADGATQDDCTGIGATCTWAASRCVPNAAALVAQVFFPAGEDGAANAGEAGEAADPDLADLTAAAQLAATQCASTSSSSGCASAGAGVVAVNSTLMAEAAAWVITPAADNTTTGGEDDNLESAVTVIATNETIRVVQNGGAATTRLGGAPAIIGAALFAAAMLLT